MAQTENWNALSQLFDLSQTDADSITPTPSIAPTASTENWNALSQLFGLEEGETTEGTGLEPPMVLRHGQFVVEAVSEAGASFVNPLDRTVQVTVVPDKTAQWTLSKNSLEKWPWVNILTGMNRAYGSTIAPKLYGAALIFKTGSSSEYALVGAQKTIALQPGESANFFCNDGHFKDNDGSVTVFWFLEACSGIVTRDNFSVEAAGEQTFTNPFDRTVTLHFVPDGEWKTHFNANAISPIGSDAPAGAGYRDSQAAIGCLLVKINGKWQAIGSATSLTLQPTQSLVFACNIIPEKANEARESITVNWVLEAVL
ncbi:hypothetical protein CKA32_004543 [Geitlerinema sp. FC II]|nr:hypothetical protein CKA32_004543 [Geitlerinema sp. FC II]